MAGLLAPVGVLARGLLGVLGQGAPAAQPPPAMGEAGTAPTSPPPQPSPTVAGSPYYHPTRDAILQMLGGAAGRLDTSLQQHDMMRWQLQHLQAIGESIKDPGLREQFYADPQGTMAALTENLKPHDTKAGDTTTFNSLAGPRTFTANQYLVDQPSGQPLELGPNGRRDLGPALGGDITEGPGGALVSKRSGLTGQQVGQFQHFPLGEQGEFVTPPLIGAQNGPSAAATGAPGPSMGLAGIPGAPQAAAAPGASQAATRGVRNNNPGNVRAVPGGWAGQTGVDPAGYAVFARPEDGQRAADLNLLAYGARDGVNTLAGAIKRWNGAGANTPQYTRAVSQLTGIAPNDPIDLTDQATRARILPAIFHVESRIGAAPPAARGGTAAGGYAGSGEAPAIGGGTVQVVNKAQRPTVSGSYAQGSVVETDPAGHQSVIQHPEYDASQRQAIYHGITDSKAYQEYQEAKTSLDTIQQIAKLPGGLGAYAMKDLYARGINPGAIARQQVLNAIGEHMGAVPNAQFTVSNWLDGKGTLSPEIAGQMAGVMQLAVAARRAALEPQAQHVRQMAADHKLPLNDLLPTDLQDAPPGTRAPGQLWSALTEPAKATAARFKGATAPVGQPSNPYVVWDHASFDSVPVGASFINPADGRVLPKARAR
jgi:hypothetical protein